MAYFHRDEAQIKASYSRRNVACGLLAVHTFFFMVLVCAFAAFALWQDLGWLWGMALLAHAGFVLWLSRRERQIRKAYGEHIVIIPADSSTQPPEVDKRKRASNFIQAADGTLLEVVDDEPSTLDLDELLPPKRKRGEDE